MGDEYLKEMAMERKRSEGRQQHWKDDNIDARMMDFFIGWTV